MLRGGGIGQKGKSMADRELAPNPFSGRRVSRDWRQEAMSLM